MRNIFVALLLIIASHFSAVKVQAQSVNPISLGFRAGLNLGDNSADFTPLSKSMRTGFAGGVYGEFGIAEGFFISPELYYVMGGTGLSYQGASATFKVDEISIPISLKYKMTLENSAAKPYFFGGFSLGFVTTSQVEGNGSTLDLKDQTSSTDFGFHVGGGLEIAASDQVGIMFDVRYSLGLSNLDKSGADSKSRNLGLIAGVKFRMN